MKNREKKEQHLPEKGLEIKFTEKQTKSKALSPEK